MGEAGKAGEVGEVGEVGEECNSEKGGEDKEGPGEDEEPGEEPVDAGAEECIEVMIETDIPRERSISVSSQGSAKRKNMVEGKFSYCIVFIVIIKIVTLINF